MRSTLLYIRVVKPWLSIFERGMNSSVRSSSALDFWSDLSPDQFAVITYASKTMTFWWFSVVLTLWIDADELNRRRLVGLWQKDFINKPELTSLIATIQSMSKMTRLTGKAIGFPLRTCEVWSERLKLEPCTLSSFSNPFQYYSISHSRRGYYDFKAVIPNQCRRYVMADAGSFTSPKLAGGSHLGSLPNEHKPN